MRLYFGWEDHAVAVEVGDRKLVGTVAELFAPLRLGEEGRDESPALELSRVGEEYRLREGGDGGRARRFRSVPNLMAALEYAITLELLAGRTQETHLHAAAAVLEGRTVVALGASGAGKSSLALAWSLGGHPILADDLVLVDEAGRVSGLPRLVKVHRRQLRLHGLSPSQTVAPHRSNAEFWWNPARARGWALDGGEPALVARVQFRRGAPIRVTPLGEAEALRVLLDNVLPGGLEPEESVDRFLEIVRSARFVHLRFGAAAQGAATLRALAAGEGS